MQLKEFLFYNDLTLSKFAEDMGVTRQTIAKITSGKMKTIRTDLLEKIVKATNGQVTVEEILNEGKGVRPTYKQDKE